MNQAQTHSLSLPATDEAVADASIWLTGLCQAHGLGHDQVFHLDLCASELIANVLEHAYAGGTGQVLLELVLQNNTARLTVGDSGPAFNPLSHHLAPQPASILEATVGGLGIHLVQEFANSVEYRRSEDGRNLITVTIMPDLPVPQAREA